MKLPGQKKPFNMHIQGTPANNVFHSTCNKIKLYRVLWEPTEISDISNLIYRLLNARNHS